MRCKVFFNYLQCWNVVVVARVVVWFYSIGDFRFFWTKVHQKDFHLIIILASFTLRTLFNHDFLFFLCWERNRLTYVSCVTAEERKNTFHVFHMHINTHSAFLLLPHDNFSNFLRQKNSFFFLFAFSFFSCNSQAIFYKNNFSFLRKIFL